MPLLRAAALALLTAAGPLLAQSESDERPWTLMIYGAADNNADGPILEFLDKIRAAWDDDAGMELVLFIDRSTGYSDDSESLGADFTGARVYRLRRHAAELLDASSHFPGLTPDAEAELDSADPENVGRFVRFCKQRFPARRYGLLIYGHANGAVMCPDDESKTDMWIPALSSEVGEDASVDFLALELCNMAGLEIAYEWRPGNGGFSADVLLAIPNAGIPLDWDRAFARVRTPGHATAAAGATLDPATMTAMDFGRLVIEEGMAGRLALMQRLVASGRIDLDNPHHRARLREAAGCFDLRAVGAAKQAIDRLAVRLAATDGKEVLEEIRGPEGARMLHYASPGKFVQRPYVDAWELMRRIADSEQLAGDVRTAAAAARDAVDAAVVASFGAEEGFGRFELDRHGLFMLFPAGSGTNGWTQLSWFTPLPPPDDGGPYGRWKFLIDGAVPANGKVENWFELLDFWFDDRTSDPRGLNRYAF